MPAVPENNPAAERLNRAMQEAEEIYLHTADEADEKE